MATEQDNNDFPAEETARRRDEVIRRMANTPPQPKLTTPNRLRREMKAGDDRAAGKPRAGHVR